MDKNINVETNLYDKISHVFGVDLEILENSITGEISIGWTRIGSEISDTWREDEKIKGEDIE